MLVTTAIRIPVLGNVPIEAHATMECHVWIRNRNVAYVICTLSPDGSIGISKSRMEEMKDAFRKIKSKVIVTSDFNAYAIGWKEPTPNSRGEDNRITKRPNKLFC